jgi:hypothetical protein
MANRGRPKAELVLTGDERQTLERWARRPSSSQALAQRCRIVLGCAAGKPNKQVAAEAGVWPQTVGVWRRRFIERRLAGVLGQPLLHVGVLVGAVIVQDQVDLQALGDLSVDGASTPPP